MRLEKRKARGPRRRRRIRWEVAFLVPPLITSAASAQSLRYRPCSCRITVSAPPRSGDRFPSAGPTSDIAASGGHAGRGALIGLAIGVGAGLGTALLLNELDPPGELEGLVGLPLLLGIWGLLVGYGVGRGT